MDQHFKEFLSRTTLHGFKYLGEKNRNLIEKIFWIISFIISIGLTITMIYKLLTNYLSSPIIMANDKFEYYIGDFEFPSVSICPPLIFNTLIHKTINYNEITKNILMNKTSINNLTVTE